MVCLLSEEKTKIRELIKEAKLNVDADNLEEASKKLHEAINMAKKMRNQESLSEIHEFIQGFTYSVEPQSIKLNPIETDGFILDIGGGGEGVVGKLNGKQVVAIDKNERELEETQNEALKIIMDATDLKFLSQSFDFCTSFFSLMYIPKNSHQKVFEEVHRVLKDSGRFLLWDVRIPEKFRDYKAFMVRLKITLPDEEIEAAYGVKWQEQNIEYFRELAERTEFKIINEWSEAGVFYLEMSKEG